MKFRLTQFRLTQFRLMKYRLMSFQWIVLALAGIAAAPGIVESVEEPAPAEGADGYSPLRQIAAPTIPPIDLEVNDARRERLLPVRVYLPESTQPAPVLLFSHGLGGSRNNNAFLARHWSARGYAAVFLQHPGSDESVRKSAPPLRRLAAMKQAASGRNFLLRIQDVPAVLDQLEQWNRAASHPLFNRLDLSRIGMSGHSFGALTTQGVSGQSIGRRSAADPRIKAALAFSPSSPRIGAADRAFAQVSIPWMLMTGTKDESLIGDADVASRLNVYPNLPAAIDKYELVLHDAEHSAFSERALPGDQQARNPNHHRAILALSTAFWDTHLQGNEEARKWLHGPGPRGVLEERDRWQLQLRE